MVIRNERKLKHSSLNTSLSSLVATYDYMFASLHPLTNFLSTQGGKLVTLDDGKIESTCLLKLCTFLSVSASAHQQRTLQLLHMIAVKLPTYSCVKTEGNLQLFLVNVHVIDGSCIAFPCSVLPPGQHRCTCRSSMCRIVFSYTMAGIQHGDL